MTNEQKTQIVDLHKCGAGYKKIAQELDISENTIKTFCRRNGLTATDSVIGNNEEVRITESTCLFCGAPVTQVDGRKLKKFCSRQCRNRWWNAHIADEKRGAMQEYTCPGCGKRFIAYPRNGRKYCSHACYIDSRFGGVSCD